MRVPQASPLPLLRPMDGLAEPRAGLFGQAMTQHPPIDAAAKLQRAKERLYVLCQLTGWGLFLAMQLGLSRLDTTPGKAPRDSLTDFCGIVMVMAMGLLLTHYARPLMTRWGWKEMGWRPLLPRIFLMAAGLALFWTGPRNTARPCSCSSSGSTAAGCSSGGSASTRSITRSTG